MRSKSVALALLVVAVVGSVAAVWMRGGETLPMPANTDAVSVAPVEPGHDEAARAGDEGPADTQGAEGDAARTDLGPDAPSDHADGPLVLVTRGDARESAGVCEVAWVLREPALTRRGALRAEDASQLSDFDLPHRFGQRAHTNRRGELRLPRLAGPTLVAVRDGNAFAGALGMPGEGRVRLQLAADEVLRLAVVDSQQRPCAGVPLAVFWAAGRETAPLWRGTTAANGEAMVRHFQPAPPQQAGERFAAAATVPVGDRAQVFQQFEGRPVPAAAVTIVLPATAPLSVSLHHRSGAPVLAPLAVLLSAAGPADDAWPLPREFDQLRASKPLGDAPVEFPHVGVGAALQLMVEVDGAQPLSLVPFTTPTTAAPSAVQATLPDSCVVLAALLVGSDDQPLGDRCIEYVLRSGATAIAGSWVTLPDGRGDIVVPTPATDAPLQLVLRSPADATAIWSASLPMLMPGERRDLGTLRLQPAGLIARGIVSDDRGQPIADAQVRVEYRFDNQRGERWTLDALLDTHSAADGSFAIHGAVPTWPFRVRADAQGHFPRTSEQLAPPAQLHLQLQRMGILKGRIMLPAWLPESAVQITMQSTSGGKRTTTLRHEGSHFWLGGLEPGIYVATVGARTMRTPLAIVDDIRIAPGENEDARLLPLDLSALRPLIVLLPDVRRVCGADRAIRVSARVRGANGSTTGPAAPAALEEGSGWLDAEGRVEIPLARGGPHDLVLHVHESAQREGREVAVPLGALEVVLGNPAPPPAVIAVDPLQLDAALRSLASLPVDRRDAR